MNTRRRYITLAGTLLAGAAILTAACGGDAGGDDSSPGGLMSEESALRNTSGATAAAGGSQPAADSFANSLADSSGKPAGGSVGETAGQEALPFDRKIIFTTVIDLSVPDITASFNEVQRVARVAGGYVEKSNLSVMTGSDSNAQRASVTLRVPASEYDDVLNSLRVLSGGKVTREEAKSNEVTEQYVDLQSRMRNLERSEQQYLTLLGQAKTIQEIMTVNDRLDGVRSQIEQAKGRLNVLDHMTDMATIDVSLAPIAAAKVQEPKSGGISSPGEAFTAAIEWSGDALRVLAAAGAVALVGLGWLIPVGAIVLVVRRLLRGRRPVVSPPTESPVAPSI